jgi:hypothetical protein
MFWVDNASSSTWVGQNGLLWKYLMFNDQSFGVNTRTLDLIGIEGQRGIRGVGV